MSAFCFVLIVAAIGQDVVKPSSYTETKKTLEKLEVLIDKAEKKPAYSTAVPAGTERGESVFFPNPAAKNVWLEAAKKEANRGKVLVADMELWLEDKDALKKESNDNADEIEAAKREVPRFLLNSSPTIQSVSLISTNRFGGVTISSSKRLQPEQAIKL